MFHLSAWQRFWRLELPFAMPALIWNMMMSVSGGWFFVVASEAITVGARPSLLPGIGSYISLAIAERELRADRLGHSGHAGRHHPLRPTVFRPLVAWADKFKFERRRRGAPHSALLPSCSARLFHAVGSCRPSVGCSACRVSQRMTATRQVRAAAAANRLARPAWNALLVALVAAYGADPSGAYVKAEVGWTKSGTSSPGL